MMKIKVERLPDLNVPRVGHVTFIAGGEPVVIGGHTTGFVPTQTAEYLSNGTWHLIETAYAHDNGLGVRLSSGKVLVGGGHEKHLGIGQTYPTEVYDPATHSFGDYGCLYTKRALAGAAEIDSGRVIIAGNWYHGDSIEVYDGKGHFTFAKAPSQQRVMPYILRTSRDDALIFGCHNTVGEALSDSIVVDRLKGEPFRPPLLSRWRTFTFTIPFHDYSSGFIGDEQKNIFAHLIMVGDSTMIASLCETHFKADSKMGIVLVRDTTFALLPTATPIPMHLQGDSILWLTSVIADRQVRHGYVMGTDYHRRLFILSIDYAPLWTADGTRLLSADELRTPLPLTLYYTDPLPQMGFNTPVVTADGNLIIAGGNFQDDGISSNYLPYSSVWLVPLGGTEHATTSRAWWPWLLLLMAVVAITAYLLWRRKGAPPIIYNGVEHPSADEPEPALADGINNKADSQTVLMDRICQLMDEQQLFRNSELKVSDVATLLGTNTRYITDCIKVCRGCTFTQFVNGYRVDHAKKLLRQYPDKKVIEVYTEAGFASETSFYRIFKTTTGMTTREWMQQTEASATPL